MTDNRTCVRRGHALIIRDDPQRYVEVMGADRNSAGAPFQYAESLFAALAMVKSMTGLSYRHLQGMLTGTLGDWDCHTTGVTLLISYSTRQPTISRINSSSKPLRIVMSQNIVLNAYDQIDRKKEMADYLF